MGVFLSSPSAPGTPTTEQHHVISHCQWEKGERSGTCSTDNPVLGLEDTQHLCSHLIGQNQAHGFTRPRVPVQPHHTHHDFCHLDVRTRAPGLRAGTVLRTELRLSSTCYIVGTVLGTLCANSPTSRSLRHNHHLDVPGWMLGDELPPLYCVPNVTKLLAVQIPPTLSHTPKGQKRAGGRSLGFQPPDTLFCLPLGVTLVNQLPCTQGSAFSRRMKPPSPRMSDVGNALPFLPHVSPSLQRVLVRKQPLGSFCVSCSGEDTQLSEAASRKGSNSLPCLIQLLKDNGRILPAPLREGFVFWERPSCSGEKQTLRRVRLGDKSSPQQLQPWAVSTLCSAQSPVILWHELHGPSETGQEAHPGAQSFLPKRQCKSEAKDMKDVNPSELQPRTKVFS